MSTSTVACYDFGANNHRRSAHKTSSRYFLGSAAVAGLVLGCAWTVYANIFAASVYPSLSSTSFDTPVIKRSPSVAALPVVPMANAKVADAFADLASDSAPAAAAPTAAASASTLTFEDRFAAAAPQGVEPHPVEAPQPQRQVA